MSRNITISSKFLRRCNRCDNNIITIDDNASTWSYLVCKKCWWYTYYDTSASIHYRLNRSVNCLMLIGLNTWNKEHKK